MTIKNKLNIFFIISVVSFIVLIFLFFISITYINLVFKNSEKITTLERKYLELHFLTDDYLKNRSQRAIKQWYQIENSIDKIILYNPNKYFQKKIFENIKKEQIELKIIFQKIINTNKNDTILLNFLGSKSMIKLEEIFSLLFNLRSNINNYNKNILTLSAFFFALNIIIIFIILFFNIYISRNHILNPIYYIIEQMKIIGTGDLNHKIKWESDNELGYFVKEFNNMTKNLKRVSSSIKVLNNEINLKNQYEKKLEKSNQDLEQYAYMASHDLKTPLISLISFSKLLKSDLGNNISEEAKIDLDFIIDSSMRMEKLINDLLEYSKIGKNIDIKKVSLKTCVNNALKNLTSIIDKNNIEIKLNENLPDVYGDELLLTLLFQNLINNSIKFKKEDDLIINIDFENGDRGVIFFIKDNGIGIDKEQINKIFLPFKRLHTAEEYPGSGIGLAICKKVIQLHNGKIWAESEGKNKGTSFKFILNITG